MIDRIIDTETLAGFLRDVVGVENVREAEPLSAHTTFKIGGPAELYAMPRDPDQIRDCMALCSSTGTLYFVLGAGSNLLVSDDGFDGVIISLTEGLAGISVDGCELTCQAGVLLKDASETACAHGLSGLEFACGIPGTVGGACFMNAGAYGGCIADVLKEVQVLTGDGRFETLPVGELDLGYRHSRIADDDMIVVSATFALTVYIRDSFRQKHGFCYYLAARSDMLRRTRAMYSTLDRICKHCTDSSVQDLAIYTQKGVRSLHIQIRQLTKSDQGTAAVLAKLEKYEKETERLEKLYIDHMLSLVPGIPKQI